VFSIRNSLIDCIFAVIFGYFGFILRRLDWPLVPLVLGLVLGSIILERMTAGASQVKSLVDLVNRPVSAVLAISVLLILCFVIWSMVKNRRSYKN
jgi:putative tricarboxylic transport membrane protein